MACCVYHNYNRLLVVRFIVRTGSHPIIDLCAYMYLYLYENIYRYIYILYICMYESCLVCVTYMYMGYNVVEADAFVPMYRLTIDKFNSSDNR